MKQNKRIIAVLVAALLTISVGTVAFASEQKDTSPNMDLLKGKSSSQTSETATTTTTAKVVATYAVKNDTAYKLPSAMTTAGNTYGSSDESILTVNKTTGNFTLIGSGSAHIIVTNGDTTKHIAISASKEKAPVNKEKATVNKEKATTSKEETPANKEKTSTTKEKTTTKTESSDATTTEEKRATKNVSGKISDWYISSNQIFLEIKTSDGSIEKIYIHKNSVYPNDIMTRLDQDKNFSIKAQVFLPDNPDHYAYIISMEYA